MRTGSSFNKQAARPTRCESGGGCRVGRPADDAKYTVTLVWDTGYPYPGLPVEQVLVVTTFVGCVGINDSRIIPLGTMED